MKAKQLLGLLLAMTVMISASAQKVRTYTSNEEDSMKCLESLSLYGEFYKQKNYVDAVVGWRKAVEICPKSRKSLYIYGANIYEALYKKEKDAAKKAALLDTLMMVYDMRIEHFGEEGYVLGRKGSDYLKLNSKDPKTAYDMLYKSFEMQGDETEAGVLVYLYQAAYRMYAKKLMEKGQLIELYPELMKVVEYNLKQGNDKYQLAEDNLNKIFAPIADCPDLIALFEPKFNADPENQDLVNQVVDLMDKKNCTESDFYITVARKKYEMEPNAEAAYSIGNWYASNQKWAEADKYYTEAAEATEDRDLKYNALIKKASVNLGLNKYSSAKQSALAALEIDNNSAEAYIIIGDAYAYGAKTVGDNPCTQRAGYWAAVDKYYKAKSLDGSLGDKINKKIASAKGQYPGKEDCFFQGISEGSSHSIGGWIGETTKVRFD